MMPPKAPTHIIMMMTQLPAEEKPTCIRLKKVAVVGMVPTISPMP